MWQSDITTNDKQSAVFGCTTNGRVAYILPVEAVDFIMGEESFVICNKLRGLSPRANYTDRAAAAGRRS